MKVEVNHEACIGCGMCKYIDEETFDYDENGYIIAKKDNITESTKEAANNCPVNAITISETNNEKQTV